MTISSGFTVIIQCVSTLLRYFTVILHKQGKSGSVTLRYLNTCTRSWLLGMLFSWTCGCLMHGVEKLKCFCPSLSTQEVSFYQCIKNCSNV